MFDHRASIIKYLEAEAKKLESRPKDEDYRRRARTYRVIASNLAAGLDLPADQDVAA